LNVGSFNESSRQMLTDVAHAALFLPASSALATALGKGHIPNFLGLSSSILCNDPPISTATLKSHLDPTRKNQRSTKATKTALVPPKPKTCTEARANAFPSSQPNGTQNH
jgi:hypothetical protein